MEFDEERFLQASKMVARFDEPQKRTRGDAITRLCKATARNVRDHSELLANTLFARAIAGDINCTKLLVSLIEKLPPPKMKYRSLALELASQPEWKGPPQTDLAPKKVDPCDECEGGDCDKCQLKP